MEADEGPCGPRRAALTATRTTSNSPLPSRSRRRTSKHSTQATVSLLPYHSESRSRRPPRFLVASCQADRPRHPELWSAGGHRYGDAPVQPSARWPDMGDDSRAALS